MNWPDNGSSEGKPRRLIITDEIRNLKAKHDKLHKRYKFLEVCNSDDSTSHKFLNEEKKELVDRIYIIQDKLFELLGESK